MRGRLGIPTTDGDIPQSLWLFGATMNNEPHDRSYEAVPAFLFDLDGTLIDSVYQHVLAWREALEKAGIPLSVWRIHRRIGMSGGLLVNALVRETKGTFTQQEAASLQGWHADAYKKFVSQVRPLPGAVELLGRLSDLRVPFAIATSGMRESAAPSLQSLNVRPEVPIITRDQVRRAKPDPDLFLAAADRLGVAICWRPGERELWEWVCSREATGGKNWNERGLIARTKIRSICSIISMRWASDRRSRTRQEEHPLAEELFSGGFYEEAQVGT
jgi:beta-phosphoglucomutase-like phosphatase (HAD superfamily)